MKNKDMQDVSEYMTYLKNKFNVSENKMHRSLFVYIRNSGNKIDLNFKTCNYVDRSAFLLTYMQENINILSSQLEYTWACILYGRNTDEDSSLLSDEELEKFIRDNDEYIGILKKFINSILLYHIRFINRRHGIDMMDDIHCNNFKNISLCNLLNILNHHGYLLLNIIGTTDIEFFDNIVNINNYQLYRLVENTPFYDLLSLIYNNIYDNYAVKGE